MLSELSGVASGRQVAFLDEDGHWASVLGPNEGSNGQGPRPKGEALSRRGGCRLSGESKPSIYRGGRGASHLSCSPFPFSRALLLLRGFFRCVSTENSTSTPY